MSAAQICVVKHKEFWKSGHCIKTSLKMTAKTVVYMSFLTEAWIDWQLTHVEKKLWLAYCRYNLQMIKMWQLYYTRIVSVSKHHHLMKSSHQEYGRLISVNAAAEKGRWRLCQYTVCPRLPVYFIWGIHPNRLTDEDWMNVTFAYWIDRRWYS